jgi:hypothetical protein
MEINAMTQTQTSRYEVRIIMADDCKTLGAIVATANEATDAKVKAGELGSTYHYGVAILDTEAGMVDAGECDGEKLIFPVTDVRIA